MGNELFISASEVNLCLAGNQLEKALVAACVGLKRYLNDPQQAIIPTSEIPSSCEAYAKALERALSDSELDPVTARLLVSELRAAFVDLSVCPRSNTDTWFAAFTKALELQKLVCRLPSVLQDAVAPQEAQSRLKQALVHAVVALAAAGAVVYAATPLGIATLGAAATTVGIGAAAGPAVGEVINIGGRVPFREINRQRAVEIQGCGRTSATVEKMWLFGTKLKSGACGIDVPQGPEQPPPAGSAGISNVRSSGTLPSIRYR
jgi:hypothetical protein